MDRISSRANELVDGSSNPQPIENSQCKCIKHLNELAKIINCVAIKPYESDVFLNRVATISSESEEGDSSPLCLATFGIATAVSTLITQSGLVTPVEEFSQQPTILSEQEKNTRTDHLEFFQDLARKGS